jgi:hypothetical protein
MEARRALLRLGGDFDSTTEQIIFDVKQQMSL